MDIATLIGILFTLGSFIGGVISATDNPLIFIDVTSIIVVVGGSFGAIFIAFSMTSLISMIGLAGRVLKKPPDGMFPLVKEIVEISEKNSIDPSYLKVARQKIVHPILKSGVDLMVEGLTFDEIMSFLEERVDAAIARDLNNANFFKVAGKFPPAFGMIGTLIGLVAMLYNMGGDSGIDTLGPAMAVALITTFYGSCLANMFFIPIAENLTSNAMASFSENTTALKGVEFIISGDNPFVIQEKLHSFLPEPQRENFLSSKSS